MSRILFLALLFFSPLLAAEKPNLLLILADDMGYGDLSCYGSKQIQTPNIDRLAAGGIRCTDSYVSNNVCAPSRAGLMTGRYGSRFGHEHNPGAGDYLKPEFLGIPLDEKLLSQRLKELGYRTGISGKWHLGESVPEQHPNARGFDFFFGMLGGGHEYFPKPETHQLVYNGKRAMKIRTPYLTDWITLEARDFIHGEGKAATEDRKKPWFLYLSYNSPHTPLEALPEDIAAFSHIQPMHRRLYCAMQRCMDRNIGTILDDLKSSGQLDNTLIVFLSDNGGSVESSHAVNAPLRGSKGTFFEGGIRVPMIYHWPARWKPRVYRKPVISLDIMATFVAAAGGMPPKPNVPVKIPGRKNPAIYDSVNLAPFFTGENDAAPHDILFWRAVTRGDAVRMGDWKLVRPNSLQPMLFNLADDISESNNLFAKHPEIVRDMLRKKIAWEVSFERAPMFTSASHYIDYNRRLYDMEFSTTQPTLDSTEDIWQMPK
ncbi:MAG: sulfatase-like hydrolase/transferase [Verrucomicrobiota bacterium]